MIKALLVAVFIWGPFVNAKGPALVFHLKSEPHTLDPAEQTSYSNYLFNNLFRGLTRYTVEDDLIFDQAERCRVTLGTQITCHLRSGLQWSDGTAVTAQDYIDSFKRIVSPKSKSGVSHLLFTVKNAVAIYDGKLDPKELGIKAKSPTELSIELERPDREFLEKLSNSALVPFKSVGEKDRKQVLTNGPYRIKSWVEKKRVVLEPNPYYKGGNSDRPLVEIVFVEDDMTAVNLYEKGSLNFLWRLPTAYIPKFRDRPDFYQKPVSRFDYIGFNLKSGSPFSSRNLREAFSSSVDFAEFVKLFFALGPPGCPSLGSAFLPTQGRCQKFEPPKIKPTLNKPIEFYYSQLGGDDIRKSAEFYQEQWRRHLGVQVRIKGLEQKHLLKVLKDQTPDSFRTGVSLTRPTCLAGLEIFTKDHPENYIGFSNAKFETLVKAMRERKFDRAGLKGLCATLNDLLFKEEVVGIPQGLMHFTMLIPKKWKGIEINDLNQLDLENLEWVGP
ncbi:MAG: peptide ABC transporter substrate-binding protein [Oligoflexia bacterium]|nr:peptide ABC transporter substrate-binding protein [Oligoflexia bacterium]